MGNGPMVHIPAKVPTAGSLEGCEQPGVQGPLTLALTAISLACDLILLIVHPTWNDWRISIGPNHQLASNQSSIYSLPAVFDHSVPFKTNSIIHPYQRLLSIMKHCNHYQPLLSMLNHYQRLLSRIKHIQLILCQIRRDQRCGFSGWTLACGSIDGQLQLWREAGLEMSAALSCNTMSYGYQWTSRGGNSSGVVDPSVYPHDWWFLKPIPQKWLVYSHKWLLLDDKTPHMLMIVNRCW